MSLRGFITNNFGLKLFSLFMALLIWFSVRFSASYDGARGSGAFARLTTRELVRVPVRFLNPSGVRQTARVEPAEADIIVSGAPHLLRKLTARDVAAFVTIEGDDMRSTVSTNQIRVHLPNGVTLYQVTPTHARVERAP